MPELPQGPVGFFSLSLSSEEKDAIDQRVRNGRLLSRQDEPELGQNDYGTLRLARGARRAELSLSATDEGVTGLCRLLDDIVARAATRPTASAKLVAHANLDGPNVRIVAHFEHAGGTAPLDVAFTRAGGQSLAVRYVLERGGRLVDERAVRPEDTERSAARGRLPKGWVRLVPEKTSKLPGMRIRMPADVEGVFARVEAVAWLRTKGHQPVEVSFTSASVSIGADPDE